MTEQVFRTWGFHPMEKAKIFDLKEGESLPEGWFDTPAAFAAADAVSETPDGIPDPIPDDWEAMHWKKQVALAEILIGGKLVISGNSETLADKAKSIIGATVDDRASRNAA